MQVQNVHPTIQAVIDAVAAAGDQPTKVARIVLTNAEMDVVQDTRAFSKTVSKHYGGSDTMTIEDIRANNAGRYISFRLNGVLFVREVVPE